MNNKGQTTVFISLLICVLLALTLTAFEGVRLYTGKVKGIACVHSMRTGILTDYNEELFKRYQLLFIDSTYGTGSNGYLEEKITDYMDVFLNGETDHPSVYEYSVEDISVNDAISILDDDMKLLKKQIMEYEEAVGAADWVANLIERVGDTSSTVESAARQTEENAREGQETISSEGVSEQEDPRDILANMLKGGILNIVMPEHHLSDEALPLQRTYASFGNSRSTAFDDIGYLNRFLRASVNDTKFSGLKQEAAFLNYIRNHFSNGVHVYDDTVMECELEYLLEGKNSDLKNMEGVANELVWMRMPINYGYLVRDPVKKKEAEAVAMGICAATGTLGLEKVVQYLLLGCWSYAEALYDVKDLLAGYKVAFLKTGETWKTDLRTLSCSGRVQETNGLYYEDYLMLLFAKDHMLKMNDYYSRMLDIMEINIQQENPEFFIKNCMGKMTIQGRIILEPLFATGGNTEDYTYYLNETISYCKEED